jgi:hypothetical protein
VQTCWVVPGSPSPCGGVLVRSPLCLDRSHKGVEITPSLAWELRHPSMMLAAKSRPTITPATVRQWGHRVIPSEL